MGVDSVHKKIEPPQIVRLNKALRLAEQWVNNMSKNVEDEPARLEPEGRPLRLGLGAKVVRQHKVAASNDPIERKLHAKVEAGKRKAAKIAKEVRDGHDNGNDIDDDDDGELESRTGVFSKRAAPPTLSLQVNKKQK